MDSYNQYSSKSSEITKKFEQDSPKVVIKSNEKSLAYSSVARDFKIISKLSSKASVVENINQLHMLDGLYDRLERINNENTDSQYNNQGHYKINLIGVRERINKDIIALKKFLPTTKQEEPAKIFKIENRFREVLKKEFPEKNKIQEIYTNFIIPLVEEAKQQITKKPRHYSTQAAAAKGKALQAGLHAIQHITENKVVIKTSVDSAQKVYLLPDQKAVFKKSNLRAKEEEQIVNDLFDIMSENAVVGSFNMSSTSKQKFGIQVPEEVKRRGYSVDENYNLSIAIQKKLSECDSRIVTKYLNAPAKLADADLENHKKMLNMPWLIKLSDGSWEEFTFNEIKKYYLGDRLFPNTLIGISPKSAVTLHEHILMEDDFIRALNFHPTHQNKKDETLYLIPDLTNQKDKNAYEICEKFLWSFTDEFGEFHNCTFKEIHTLQLVDLELNNMKYFNEDDLDLFVEDTDLERALSVGWKIFSPELMKIEAGKVSSLIEVQAKPFISEMELIADLTMKLREVILERLNPNSEFNAILTGELQLLDLHAANLGVAPSSNEEYERFKELDFIITLGSGMKYYTFKSLILDHLSGKLSKNSLINFIEEGKSTTKTLQDLPELQKALDVQWELVIFDTDLSMAESNLLHYKIRKNEIEHFITLRSVLLGTKWKDKPLSQTTIDRLSNSSERDSRVLQWSNRADSPVYKRLSKSTQENIFPILNSFISKYNLSDSRRENKNVTLRDLKQKFVKSLSIMNDQTSNFWAIIEANLSNVNFLKNDTWSTLAKRHGQDIMELKRLNTGKEGEGINPNKIRIDYDLTSDSLIAVKRREKIASQLFPRLTDPQSLALQARQRRRTRFFVSFKELSESNLEGIKLLDQIEQYIKKSEVPLTSIRRKEFLNIILLMKKAEFNNTDEISKLKQTLCVECQPTYFNLMKAMYPLLADAYALNQIVYGDNVLAGDNIGNYKIPLEVIIEKAKNIIRPNSLEWKLVANLENAVKNTPNPSFTGYY